MPMTSMGIVRMSRELDEGGGAIVDMSSDAEVAIA